VPSTLYCSCCSPSPLGAVPRPRSLPRDFRRSLPREALGRSPPRDSLRRLSSITTRSTSLAATGRRSLPRDAFGRSLPRESVGRSGHKLRGSGFPSSTKRSASVIGRRPLPRDAFGRSLLRESDWRSWAVVDRALSTTGVPTRKPRPSSCSYTCARKPHAWQEQARQAQPHNIRPCEAHYTMPMLWASRIKCRGAQPAAPRWPRSHLILVAMTRPGVELNSQHLHLRHRSRTLAPPVWEPSGLRSTSSRTQLLPACIRRPRHRCQRRLEPLTRKSPTNRHRFVGDFLTHTSGGCVPLGATADTGSSRER
jgi:hypothetical protein